MLRILLIITLILLATPFFIKVKDYSRDKIKRTKITVESAEESLQKISQKIKKNGEK